MSQSLRILFVEDLPTDQELAAWQLREGGLDFTSLRVETRETFLQALDHFQPDLIISDYAMPEFDGMQALKLTQESKRDIPFLILTGSMNEETAAECIKAGASDYVIKEHIHRLPYAVQEALKNQQIRQEKEETERRLIESELRYHGLFENSPISLWEEDFSSVKHYLDDLRGLGVKDFSAFFIEHPDEVLKCACLVKILDVNKVTLQLFGAVSKEQLFTNMERIILPNNFDNLVREFGLIAAGVTQFSMEAVNQTFDGRTICLNIYWAAAPGYLDDLSKVIISKVDITEHKQAEEAVQKEHHLMQSLMDTLPDSIYFKDAQNRFIRVNRAQIKKLGASDPVEVLGKTDFDFFASDHAQAAYQDEQEIIRTGQPLINIEEMETYLDRPVEWVSTTKMPLRDKMGETIGTFGISRDITELKLAQKTLQESEERHRKLIEESHELIFIHDLELNIMSMNPAMENMFSSSHQLTEDLNLYKLAPIRRHKAFTTYIQKIARDGIDSGQWTLVSENDQERILNYKSTLIEQPNRVPVVRCMAQEITEKVLHDQEMEAMAAISSALRSFTSMDDMMPAILHVIDNLIKIDGFAFSSMREENRGSIVKFSSGEWKSWEGNTVLLDIGIYGEVFETSSSLIDDKAAYRPVSNWPGRLGNIQTVFCVPLIANNLFIGAFWFGRRGNFSAANLKILRTLSDFCANALRNADLYHQIQDRASTLVSLYDAGLAINSILEPYLQLEFLSTIIMNEFHADRIVFLRYFPSEYCFIVELCLGFPTQLQVAISRTHFPADESQFPIDWVRVNELPLNKPELLDDSGFSLGDTMVRSVLWTPVKHGKNMQGILGLMSINAHAFTPDQERLFLLFANQAAVALENASLLSETRLQVERLKTLRKIDETINASLDLNLTTNVLTDQIMQQLNVDAIDFLLYNPITKSLKFINNRGFHTPALQHTDLRLGQGLAGRAANEREIVHISDLNTGNEFFQNSPFMKEEHFIEYYGIPLLSKGTLRGVLQIFNRSPLKPNAAWLEFLETLAGQAAIAIDNIQMFENLQRSNNELTMAYDSAIEGWSRALDLRDKETEGHTRRVTEITVRLAKASGIHGEELIQIRRGALLHDIGKMGIPDNILLKPGPLTDDEWKIMKKHPDFAFELLSPIIFLKAALDIPYCHHEKWDGSGYPRGIKGEQIPASARLFAIVDVWDALTSDRPYRKAWPESQAIEYIREQAGKHFDPRAVELFINGYLFEESPSTKPTILIVDDEESVTRSLARSLKDHFSVLTANSGEDALRIAERSDLAVVLTDQRMPGMSGVELLDRIRTLRPKSVGIIISGYSDVVALTAALNLTNVRGFIPKPWDLDNLRKKLDDAVAQYREMSRGFTDEK